MLLGALFSRLSYTPLEQEAYKYNHPRGDKIVVCKFLEICMSNVIILQWDLLTILWWQKGNQHTQNMIYNNVTSTVLGHPERSTDGNPNHRCSLQWVPVLSGCPKDDLLSICVLSHSHLGNSGWPNKEKLKAWTLSSYTYTIQEVSYCLSHKPECQHNSLC